MGPDDHISFHLDILLGLMSTELYVKQSVLSLSCKFFFSLWTWAFRTSIIAHIPVMEFILEIQVPGYKHHLFSQLAHHKSLYT